MKRGIVMGFLALALGCGGDSDDEGAPGSSKSPVYAPGDVIVDPNFDPFDPGVLASFEFTLAPEAWSYLQNHLEDGTTWQRATLQWRGETWTEVAIQPAGQSSRDPAFSNPDKPSLWVSFKEFVPGREFHRYERIKLDGMLDDPAMMRERLAYGVYAARGVPAPRIAHCRVYVNGTYRGLYVVEERVNKEFLTKRFGKDQFNQLYKWTEAEPDLLYRPELSAAFYVPNMWEPRIDTLEDGAADVENFVRVVNTSPGAAEGVFDVENFLNWIAVETATGETDGYIGSSYLGKDPVTGQDIGDPNDFYTGNIFMSKVPGTDRYRWIVWDRDQAFWRMTDITFGFDRRIVTRRVILDVPGNLDRYRSVLRQVMDGAAHPAQLEAQFDAILLQIRQAALEDPYRRSAFTLESEWADLRGFFRRRYDFILSQL